MKLRRPRLYSVMTWIIAIALSLAPVMAQTTPDTGFTAPATQADGTTTASADNQKPVVDTSVLPELPLATTANTFPNVSRNSTPAAAPNPTKPSQDVEPGGKSKWPITVIIITAATVAGIILLLRWWSGGDNKPTGTVITAGTPSVAVPTH